MIVIVKSSNFIPERSTYLLLLFGFSSSKYFTTVTVQILLPLKLIVHFTFEFLHLWSALSVVFLIIFIWSLIDFIFDVSLALNHGRLELFPISPLSLTNTCHVTCFAPFSSESFFSFAIFCSLVSIKPNSFNFMISSS